MTAPDTTPTGLHSPRPPLVTTALEMAHERGFGHSCRDEVGRLLLLLSRAADVAELGTGAGVGAAWLAAGRPESLVTVESDGALAAHAAAVLGDRAEVVHDSWEVLLGRGTYDLVFSDAKAAKYDPRAFELLARGGLLVLDDLTPPALQPTGWTPADDPLRVVVAEHAAAWSEVQVADDHSVILARAD